MATSRGAFSLLAALPAARRETLVDGDDMLVARWKRGATQGESRRWADRLRDPFGLVQAPSWRRKRMSLPAWWITGRSKPRCVLLVPGRLGWWWRCCFNSRRSRASCWSGCPVRRSVELLEQG